MGIKNIFNDLFSTTEETDEVVTTEVEAAEEEKEEKKAEKPAKAVKTEKSEPVRTARPAPAAATLGALELKICKPQSFSEVGSIADHLINKCTVVLNLETTSKETARRIVDFLNGVAYSIDGQIKPVANNTFVITPRTVSVTGEEADEELVEEASAEDSSFDNF